MKNELSRSQRTTGLIIAGLVAAISSLITAVTASMALSQSIHTAQYVNQLVYNTSQALKTRDHWCKDSRLAGLESTVIATDDEVETLQWQLQLRCHAAYKNVCVNNAPRDSFQWEWNKICSRLLEVWQHTNLSFNLHNFHQEIIDIQNARLDMIDPRDLAKQVLEHLKGFKPFNMLKHTLLVSACFAVCNNHFVLLNISWLVSPQEKMPCRTYITYGFN